MMGAKMKKGVVLLLMVVLVALENIRGGECELEDVQNLKMYVDELPKIPKIYGYTIGKSGTPQPGNLTIGMYKKLWKFHRDLPAAPVFVYGTTAAAATFPGPTIEALRGTPTHVRWENHLPSKHILPWDPTVPTAIAKKGGVPAVVHLHGGIDEPQSDGSAFAWYTADFNEKGPAWSKPTYTYNNAQHAGNLWYHDHALGLTRASLLAGLLAPYVVRDPLLEAPFMLPTGEEFDRHLVIADRSFNKDGSIFMNFTGNNPDVHPEWQPEYFGDTITVNGKVWPYMKVQRRRYRFRIINASNARYLRLALTDGLPFTVVGSDFSYLTKPARSTTIIMSPAEIYDVVVDFSSCAGASSEIEMTNDAAYPFPDGESVEGLPVSKVMKFVLVPKSGADDSRVPSKLAGLPPASVADGIKKRYIVMYEYAGATGAPTHLYINGKRLEDPATETPKSGSTEVWEVINLTKDNHPLHLHLAAFQAVEARELDDLAGFERCMTRHNDAVKCDVGAHATGAAISIPEYERAWKNVVKIAPGTMTTIVVKFNLVDGDAPYPFDATAEPGYVYHCHILDHEDNAMIRPLKLVA